MPAADLTAVNLSQLHAELAAAVGTVPDGWGLVAADDWVEDRPATATEAQWSAVLAAHVSNPDFGRSEDELELVRQALAVMEQVLVDLDAATTLAGAKAAIRPGFVVLRRLVKVVARQYPS